MTSTEPTVYAELVKAIREAIALGIGGESIAAVDLLIERFPELAEPAQTCDVCGTDTFGDDEAGTFTELDGQPFVCSRVSCNETILADR